MEDKHETQERGEYIMNVNNNTKHSNENKIPERRLLAGKFDGFETACIENGREKLVIAISSLKDSKGKVAMKKLLLGAREQAVDVRKARNKGLQGHIRQSSQDTDKEKPEMDHQTEGCMGDV